MSIIPHAHATSGHRITLTQSGGRGKEGGVKVDNNVLKLISRCYNYAITYGIDNIGEIT